MIAITSDSVNANQIASITYATDRAREVYDEVSQNSYETLVREFSELGPKLYGTHGNDDTKDWILDKLQNVTNGKVIGQIVGGFENVIGKLTGSMGSSGPMIMIGAHFDTIEVAPGANDDGSGVATTLELARVLSQYSWPVDIYFGFWNDEESGLHGSNEIAHEYYNDEVDILIYYNIDMLLTVSPSLPEDEKIIMYYANQRGADFHDAQYWAELTKVVGNNFGVAVTNPIPSSETSSWAYSDHAPFEAVGYRSVIFAHESGGALDSAYHTSGDIWSNPIYNYYYATKATASIGASIAFALGRVQNQLFYESHEIDNLASSSSRTLLLEMSTETELKLTFTSSMDTSLLVRVYDPLGQQVRLEEVSTTSGSSGSISLETGMDGIYEVVIVNAGGGLIDFEVEMEYETDIDGDDQPDSESWWHNSFQTDSDNDGISDADEEDMGSDPHNSDQDNDTLSDYDEIYIYGTAFNNNDTDDDSIDDAFEIQVGLNPLVKDSDRDPDYDGLSNLGEYLAGTDLFAPDTDLDLMLDGWEVAHGLDPLRDDAYEDPDGDTMENLYEYRSGNDPQVFDGPLLTVIPTGIGTAAIILSGIIWLGVRRKHRR